MKHVKNVFNYLKPLWSGDDGKISLRSVLAIVFSVDMLINIHTAVKSIVNLNSLKNIDKIADAAIINALSMNLDRIEPLLTIEALFVAALLGMKAVQNTLITKTAIQNKTDVPPVE